jgi:hypothetical protein
MEFRRYSAIVPGCQGIRQGLGASQAQTRPWSVVAAMTDPVQPEAVGVPGQPVKTATGDPMALNKARPSVVATMTVRPSGDQTAAP